MSPPELGVLLAQEIRGPTVPACWNYPTAKLTLNTSRYVGENTDSRLD
jgi:hypothetical protein